MRPFGVPEVGVVSSPAHVLHLYEHGGQFLDVSARFCLAGLENGECCLWITAPPWTDVLALGEIIKHMPAAYEYVTTGQLQFVPYEDWYLGGGNDVQAILDGARARIAGAARRGWRRVRACGNALQPLSEADWAKRVQYEEALHRFMEHSDVIGLCSYRLGSLPHGVRTACEPNHHATITHRNEGISYRADGRPA